jgi:uncharacterized protein (TIRG00374 family)
LAKTIIKLAVTVLIFILIFREVNVKHVGAALRSVNLTLVLIALMVQLLSTIVASYRWFLIMKALQFGQNFSFYLRSYFKGTFFNQGLPTTIGGDALRVLDAAKLGFKKRESFYGVFIDRIVGLLGLLLLNLLANGLNPDLLDKKFFYLINGIVVTCIVGILSVMAIKKITVLEKYPVGKLFFDLSTRLNTVYRRANDAAVQISLSVVIHFLSIVSIFALGKSVGLQYDLLTYLVIMPPVFLLTLIPISLAGWGVREGAMLGLFLLIGANKTLILTVSLMYGFIVLVTSLPGLVFYLRGSHSL